MAAGISIREFARREGVSDTLVRKALRKGTLAAGADGKLDARLVGSDWRAANRPAEDRRSHVPPSATAAETPPIGGVSGSEGQSVADALDGLSSDPRTWSLAQAERWKEIYLALQRQLKFEVESGRYVAIDEVVQQVEREYATVRERLLVIPGKLAAMLLGLDREAIEAALQGEIVEALGELHDPALGDRAGDSGAPPS
ncbi:hypothetical protein [Rhodoplanes roseus]|uniref:Terminase small subunit n=1 Tax=Rhodoplanes roseus TaxID=29409 RepID=A0A327KX17_9BRAD|nr:hypothetical protein [Rhodoplanes roseus]RAI42636.1 hypothetical protein CH341_18420 [Rhodoplanes roseus]